jgi:hypothetical protein
VLDPPPALRYCVCKVLDSLQPLDRRCNGGKALAEGSGGRVRGPATGEVADRQVNVHVGQGCSIKGHQPDVVAEIWRTLDRGFAGDLKTLDSAEGMNDAPSNGVMPGRSDSLVFRAAVMVKVVGWEST